MLRLRECGARHADGQGKGSAGGGQEPADELAL